LIRNFKDAETENIFNRIFIRRFSQQLQRAARRKLLILDSAERLMDLNVPPGNRLEALKGNRKGQYSIRINDQWRICFRWTGSDAEDVEMADYH
jgi:proteic killer suppression protein